uniref:Uncharacterized protein n=1 Tax=Rhizophora mucronata TaxID=61149 RepID=A0A2P2PMD6_RHIMU
MFALTLVERHLGIFIGLLAYTNYSMTTEIRSAHKWLRQVCKLSLMTAPNIWIILPN